MGRLPKNIDKVKWNKQLPYLAENIVEVMEPEAEDMPDVPDVEEAKEGAGVDIDAHRKKS